MTDSTRQGSRRGGHDRWPKQTSQHLAAVGSAVRTVVRCGSTNRLCSCLPTLILQPVPAPATNPATAARHTRRDTPSSLTRRTSLHGPHSGPYGGRSARRVRCADHCEMWLHQPILLSLSDSAPATCPCSRHQPGNCCSPHSSWHPNVAHDAKFAQRSAQRTLRGRTFGSLCNPHLILPAPSSRYHGTPESIHTWAHRAGRRGGRTIGRLLP